MIDFNTIWQILLEHGSARFKEEGTRRYWLTLSDEQQQTALTNITTKLQRGGFVHFDPIQAIKENCINWQKPREPTFLRGDEPGDLVQVKYNGLFKICTRETMNRFNLEYVRDW
jgi:hypothetical protein